MEIEQLEADLQKGDFVIYIAENFPWKDLVTREFSGRERVKIVSDPAVLKLYRTYEFSNRFIVFDENRQYGSIWNYVREGLMTAEEAIDSLVDIG